MSDRLSQNLKINATIKQTVLLPNKKLFHTSGGNSKKRRPKPLPAVIAPWFSRLPSHLLVADGGMTAPALLLNCPRLGNALTMWRKSSR